jgi:hypothetical protein
MRLSPEKAAGYPHPRGYPDATGPALEFFPQEFCFRLRFPPLALKAKNLYNTGVRLMSLVIKFSRMKQSQKWFKKTLRIMHPP